MVRSPENEQAPRRLNPEGAGPSRDNCHVEPAGKPKKSQRSLPAPESRTRPQNFTALGASGVMS